MILKAEPNNFVLSKTPASVESFSMPFLILCSCTGFIFGTFFLFFTLVTTQFELLSTEELLTAIYGSLLTTLSLDAVPNFQTLLMTFSDKQKNIFNACIFVSIGSGVILSFLLGLWAKKKTTTTGERKVAGTNYYEFTEAEKNIKASLKQEYQYSGIGLSLHSNLSLPKSREGQHVLVCGQIGSGKTSVILPTVNQIIERKSKSIIFDIKGDYSSYFRHLNHVSVLAAFDQSSMQWSISKDVYDSNSAMQFSEAIIPLNDKQDPLWIQSSRQILVGILLALIDKYGQQGWGWSDLSEMLKLPDKYLHRQLMAVCPEAGQLVDENSKTSKSMILTMQSYTAPIHHISAAWGNARKGISLNEWVTNQKSDITTIIIQQNPQFKALSEIVSNLALTFISQALLALEDDINREFYLVLDEIFHLNFNVIDFMTVSRSKGARMIIGVQDLALLTRKMTKEEVMAFASMIGTTIMLRVGAMGETIKTIADSMGEQEVERLQASFDMDGKATYSWHRSSRPVVSKDDLLMLPQPTKQGIHGFICISGTGIVGKLCWDLPQFRKHSKPFQLAKWIDEQRTNSQSNKEERQ